MGTFPAHGRWPRKRQRARRPVPIDSNGASPQIPFENACRVVRNGGTVSSVGVYGAFPELRLPTDGSFMHRKIVTTLCPVGTARMGV